MKKMNFKNILFSAALAAGAMSLASCSLEEENPGGFTMENMAANSVESYQTLLNQCYFGMEFHTKIALIKQSLVRLYRVRCHVLHGKTTRVFFFQRARS